MAKEEKEKPKAKVIKPESKKSTAKKQSTNKTTSKVENKDEFKEIIDKGTEVIKEEASLAAEKISKVSNEISSKVASAASDTPIVTKETMNRVVYALIIIVMLWIIIKIFGLFIENGENLFTSGKWATNRAQSYLASLTNNSIDELTCDKKNKYKGGYIVECSLNTYELQNKWMTNKLYVGVIEGDNDHVDYCTPSTSKSVVKKCLRKK